MKSLQYDLACRLTQRLRANQHRVLIGWRLHERLYLRIREALIIELYRLLS